MSARITFNWKEKTKILTKVELDIKLKVDTLSGFDDLFRGRRLSNLCDWSDRRRIYLGDYGNLGNPLLVDSFGVYNSSLSWIDLLGRKDLRC